MQVALPELHAERGQHREVAALLDALGEQPRADPPAERDERLDERLLRVVAARCRAAISRSILMIEGWSAAMSVKLA